jgi:hypothetical protein
MLQMRDAGNLVNVKCPILLTDLSKIVIYLQILVKLSNIKFYKHSFVSRFVTSGQTDRQTYTILQARFAAFRCEYTKKWHTVIVTKCELCIKIGYQ